MRKIVFILVVLLLPIKVSASVIVMDRDTNRILYGVNEEEQLLIASTTKIMTSLVVLNNVDIKEVVEVDESILKSYGSNIYIEVGEKITVEDLLYGLMLRSGNDAAMMLATYVGGSEDGFVILMNEMAKSIGMKKTTFINASGLEDDKGNGNISTAYDMGLLMNYAMQHKIFKTITGTKKRVVKTNYKTYEWYNKNKLLDDYKYTTGGKTGFTRKAYRTLVTTASKDGKNLTIVTLHQANDFAIHEKLYEEHFKKYKLVEIIDADTFMNKEGFYVKEDFKMLLADNEINNVKIEVEYTNDAIDRIGYVTVSLYDNIYYQSDLYLIANKEEKESFWERIKDFFVNLFN